jgi:hypothetical protein
MIIINLINRHEIASKKRRFLPLTNHLLLITLYQLPYTIYQQPTLPIDNALKDNRIRNKKIGENFEIKKMVGSISLLLFGYFNHTFNQPWSCLDSDGSTDPNPNLLFHNLEKINERMPKCGPA